MNLHQTVNQSAIQISTKITKVVNEPSSSDILCGRGKSFLQHPGNKTFSNVIRSNLKRYIDAPSRIERSHVVADVVRSLRLDGFRFLKRDEMSKAYYELSMDQSREKTGHAIRDLVKLTTGKKLSKGANKQSKQSIKKKRSVKKAQKASSNKLNAKNKNTTKPLQNEQQQTKEEGTPTKRVFPHNVVLDEGREGKRWSRHCDSVLNLESLLEFGLFDLGTEEPMIEEPSKQEASSSQQPATRSAEGKDLCSSRISLTPLPLSSAEKIMMNLADISRITAILIDADETDC